MTKIERVAIVGGVHGNEFTGAYLIKKFEQFPELIKKYSFETLTLLGNPEAFEKKVRYLDKDLNRCFAKKDLQKTKNAQLSNYEETLAQSIYQMLKLNSESLVDVIIDLHSTTANMGLTLIVMNNNLFNLQLAAYLSSIIPSLKVYSFAQSGQEQPFLNALCDLGFAIEVGPIAQGVLNADIFHKTENLLYAILNYFEGINQGKMQLTKLPLTVYQHLEFVDYPKNENGEIQAMIHPNLQDKDYEALNPGEPMFLTLDNKTIPYQGTSVVWPIFINEAAYYSKGIAMSLTQKQEFYL